MSKRTVATKTADYNVLTGDSSKVLVMDSADDKVFSLPSVGVGDVGVWYTFAKVNSGKVTVQAADDDTVMDGDAGGGVANDQAGEDYATITLLLAAETKWVSLGGDGTWATFGPSASPSPSPQPPSQSPSPSPSANVEEYVDEPDYSEDPVSSNWDLQERPGKADNQNDDWQADGTDFIFPGIASTNEQACFDSRGGTETNHYVQMDLIAWDTSVVADMRPLLYVRAEASNPVDDCYEFMADYDGTPSSWQLRINKMVAGSESQVYGWTAFNHTPTQMKFEAGYSGASSLRATITDGSNPVTMTASDGDCTGPRVGFGAMFHSSVDDDLHVRNVTRGLT